MNTSAIARQSFELSFLSVLSCQDDLSTPGGTKYIPPGQEINDFLQSQRTRTAVPTIFFQMPGWFSFCEDEVLQCCFSKLYNSFIFIYARLK